MITAMPDIPSFRAAVAVVALLLLTAPRSAGAQEGAADPVQTVRRAYSGEVADRVRDVLARAEQRGLGRASLAEKALEGAAKRVPADRLVEALGRRLARLERAREALGPGADAASLEAAGEALGRGLSAEHVRRVAEAASDAERPAALVALAELKTIGVPVDRALAAVESALARGAGPGELMELGTRVRVAMRRGARPGAAARAAARGPGPGALPVAGALVPTGLPAASGPPVPPGTGPPAGSPGGGRPGGDPPGVPGPASGG